MFGKNPQLLNRVKPLSPIIKRFFAGGSSKNLDFNAYINYLKRKDLSIDSLILGAEENVSQKTLTPKILAKKNRLEFELEPGFLLRLTKTLDNLIKFLSTLTYTTYYKIQTIKIEDIILEKQHTKLQNYLSKRVEDADKEDKIVATTEMTDSEKIEKLKKTLTAIAGGTIASSITEDLTGIQTGSVDKKGAVLAKQMMTKYGLTDVQAAAIFGTMSWESSLIPYNVENSSPYNRQEPLPPPYGATYVGYGWPQWTNISNTPGDRLNVFITKFLGGGPGKRGRAATDQDNFNYLTWELDNRAPYKGRVIADLKKQTTIESAVNSFLSLYEGVPGNRFAERVQRTKGILKEMRKASGGLIMPKLFDKDYQIDFQSSQNELSQYVVDRPTLIDVESINEPLIIIPLGRPMGQTILKILFEKKFQKIEDDFKQETTQIYKGLIEQLSVQSKMSKKVMFDLMQNNALNLTIDQTTQPEVQPKTYTNTNTKENIEKSNFINYLIQNIPNVIKNKLFNVNQSTQTNLNSTLKTGENNINSKNIESNKTISRIDSTEKLSTQTDDFVQSMQNVVIYTRDIFV
jgi:hypothetical protein